MCIECKCGLDSIGLVVDKELWEKVQIEGCAIPGCHDPKSKE
jgi:hypothetical protein